MLPSDAANRVHEGAADTDRDEDPRVGRIIGGRYRLIEPLACGGMGVVYRAERVELGRIVAVKFLLSPLAGDRRHLVNFEREARAMSRLSHPHCVPVIDFGVDHGPFLVMEFVAGKTLKDLIAEGPVPWERAVRIARQLLAGLAHAHGHHIIHRDIKPGNIMLTEATGMGDHVRILDFGLAQWREHSTGPDSTSSNAVWGTPQYMAPEQWRSERADERTDIYAVGILLYEMLAGQRPFPDGDRVALMNAHASEPPPPLPRKDLPHPVPQALEAVVRRALEKSPADRYQSAEAFRDELGEVLRQHGRGLNAPWSLAPDPPAPRERRATGKTRKRPVPAATPASQSLGSRLAQVTFSFLAAAVAAGVAFWNGTDALPFLRNASRHLEGSPASDSSSSPTPGPRSATNTVASPQGGAAAPAAPAVRTAAPGGYATLRGDDLGSSEPGSATPPPAEVEPLAGPPTVAPIPPPPPPPDTLSPAGSRGEATAAAEPTNDPGHQDGTGQENGKRGNEPPSSATARPDAPTPAVATDDPEKGDTLAPAKLSLTAATAADASADTKKQATGADAPAEAAPAAKSATAEEKPDAPQSARPSTPARPRAKSRRATASNAPGSSLAEVRRLIARGRKKEAVAALQRMRSRQPRNAQLPYLIGTLYYDMGWWSDAFLRYSEAMRLDRRYRRRSAMLDQLIGGLGSDKTYRLAARILERDAGAAALPRLRHASNNDPRPRVRVRAKALYLRIKRRR